MVVRDLPPAPPVKKEDIPVVCQSENLVFIGEVTTRITYQVFIEGEMSIIIADHNRRSLCTTLEVEDKVIKQWDGVTLEKFAEQPYTFYVRGQKFVLLWIIQPEDAEGEDTFELQANGVSLS